MAAFKSLTLLLAVAVAAVFAADEGKDKRDVIIGAIPSMHYASPLMRYPAAPSMIHYAAAPAAIPMHARTMAVPAYDDGKYFPGKYEKPTFYPGMPHMIAV